MKLVFEADTLEEIMDQMVQTLFHLGHPWAVAQGETEEQAEAPAPEPKKAKKKVAKAPVEEETPVEEEETPVEGMDMAELKKEALTVLIELYNNLKARPQVKELLVKYDVKKFSEIPERHSPGLWKDANEIRKAVA